MHRCPMPHVADENLMLVVPQLDNLVHEWPRHRGSIGGNLKTLMRHIEDLKGLRKPLPKMPPQCPYCAAVHFRLLILFSPNGR
jgi:hypothetical protein